MATSCSSNHTLEIREGTLWAWGDNTYGQLGDSSNTTRNSPVQIGKDDDWVIIAAGDKHSLGLKSNGTLWAWGNNNIGQLGDSSTKSKLTPTLIGTDNNWIGIAAGQAYSTALKSNGTLWAWGNNIYGQLGLGDTLDRIIPVQIGIEKKWINLSVGAFHTIGLKSDGTLWAWGNNSFGQLGDTSTINRISPVQIGSNNNWTYISAGAYHTLCLKSNGTLWAWGSNTNGQLGNSTTTDQIYPIKIGSDKNWVSVAAGTDYSLALKSNGTIWGWGLNDYGQLGDSTTTNHNAPLQIGKDNNWVSIATGYNHSLALQSNSSLWGWGNNSFGQIGDSTLVDKTYPVITSDTFSIWLILNVFNYRTLGLKTDGAFWGWGFNSINQLGTHTDPSSPVRLAKNMHLTSISVSREHTLVINSDGTLWGWGSDDFGQVGDSSGISGLELYAPTRVGTDNKWVSISAGAYYSLGLKSDGTAWGWGGNWNGELGNGSTNVKYAPTQIGKDSQWVSLAAGLDHSFGLKSNGTLWAWGHNLHGSLGDNSANDRPTPVQIGKDNKWISVVAGDLFSIAVKSDGTLWAWGYNPYGQVGDSTVTDVYSPVQIGSDSDWMKITAGEHHSGGIKSNGTLWGWGCNNRGEYGDGTKTERHVPTKIGSNNNWLQIFTGFFHTAGLSSNRRHYCASGDNYAGQLGNGDTIAKTSFVCNTNCLFPQAPVNITSSSKLKICTGQNTILTASGVGKLGWYSADSAGKYLGGGSNYTTPNLTSDTAFYVQDSSCGASETRTKIYIKVNPLPLPISSANRTICNGDSLVIGPNPASGNNYSWSSNPSGFSSTAANPTLIPNTTTTYFFTQTINATQCSRSASITVVVNPKPTVGIQATATSICPGTTITLSGTGATSYIWTGGINDGVPFVPTSSYNYIVTGTDGNNCSDTESVIVTVNPVPSAATTLTGSTIAAVQSGASYQWLDCNNGYSPISGATSQSYSPTSNGSYAVVVTLNNCTNTSTCTNIKNVGINNIIQNNNIIEVYPNPNTGIFTIQSSTEGSYYIINELGQTIQLFKLNNANKYTINIENLSGGVYYIVGYNNNETTSQKVVVVK